MSFFPRECLSKRALTIYEGGLRNKSFGKYAYDRNNIKKSILALENEKFVFFLGTIEPRKNIRLLIKAAPILKSNIKVIVCGKIGWEKKDIIKKLTNTENLIYYDYINQDEKSFLMTHAFCQVQPSIYEGFGLPVVESMQAGTVVLVADNSSLSELVERDELKFQTYIVEDFCNKLLALINNRDLYNNMKEYCKQRGSFFSWEKAAQQYLDVFKTKNQR